MEFPLVLLLKDGLIRRSSSNPYNFLSHPLIESCLDGLNWWKKAIDMASKLEVKAIGGPFEEMSVEFLKM